MGLTSPRQRGSACSLVGSVLHYRGSGFPHRGSGVYDSLPNFPRGGNADPPVQKADPCVVLPAGGGRRTWLPFRACSVPSDSIRVE
jgi:hypothetical protein